MVSEADNLPKFQAAMDLKFGGLRASDSALFPLTFILNLPYIAELTSGGSPNPVTSLTPHASPDGLLPAGRSYRSELVLVIPQVTRNLVQISLATRGAR